MDISADLTELGRTPVTVVSSGCKSFLDIPRTLEYLETEGVGVGTFADGRTGNVDFPAFWSRDSGVKSPTTIENEMDAAAIIRKSGFEICHCITDDIKTHSTHSKSNLACFSRTRSLLNSRFPRKRWTSSLQKHCAKLTPHMHPAKTTRPSY